MQKLITCSFRQIIIKPNLNYQVNRIWFSLSFGNVCMRLQELSTIQARNKQLEVTKEFLDDVWQNHSQEDFLNSLRILTCSLAPRLSGKEINIARSSINQCLAEYFKIEEKQLEDEFNQDNDLKSLINQQFEKDQIEKHNSNHNKSLQVNLLSVKQFFELIDFLIKTTGTGSREEKETEIINIFKLCQSGEQLKFIIRILNKSLRIGIAEKSIIKIIEEINGINKFPLDVLEIIERDIIGIRIKQKIQSDQNADQQSELEKDKSIIPISPMLSQSIYSVEDLKKFSKKFINQRIIAETQFDGQRTQIHYRKGEPIVLFSRNLEPQNEKFVNLVNNLEIFLSKNTQINSAILDGEIISIDQSTFQIKSFQSLQNRPRKLSTEENQNTNRESEDLESQIIRENTMEQIQVFDILMFNGVSIIDKTLQERKQILNENFYQNIVNSSIVPSCISVVDSIQFDLELEENYEQLLDLLQRQIEDGQEGLIVKFFGDNSFYDDRGGRTQWVQLQKNIVNGGMADSLDLIPIAAYYGKGKRSSFYGAYLMGAPDFQSNQIHAICKVGTGFSDQFLNETSKLMNKFISKEKPNNFIVSQGIKPDVWLNDTQLVWEIQCEQMTLSSVYTIGQGIIDKDSGISLRFPRLKRVRTDKSFESSSSLDQIIELYEGNLKKN